MKFGFSSYSFHQKISTGEMSLFDVIDWVAESEGEHLELAVLSNAGDSPIPTINSDPEYVAKIKAHAAERGVILSNLAVSASFLSEDPAEIAAEVLRGIERVSLNEPEA